LLGENKKLTKINPKPRPIEMNKKIKIVA